MSDVIEQRTDEWRLARAGKITASRFADAIDITQPEPGAIFKSGPRKGQPKLPASSAARNKYLREVVFERLSEVPTHEIGGYATRWGTDVESFAREAFELETGLIVLPGQFVTHPDHPFIGCSPDGLISADGGYESKCPMDEAVHINTWLCGMPEEHKPQVQGCMLVTGRLWWEFVSYDPRVAERFRLYHQRIERDNEYIDGVLLPGLLQFEQEVQQMIAQLEAKAA